VIAVDGFETARLRAEPIGPRYRDELIALFGDERVGATLGGIVGPAAVDERIAGMTAHWEREGFGWYAFCDRERGALLACGGPHRRHVGGSVVSFTLPDNPASRRVMEKLRLPLRA
jgi:RimJ/RimL family protein N-acetyltransferase